MTCEIIKDLIPMYVDDAASEETKELVEKHIKCCSDCSEYCRICKKTEDKIREPLYGKEKAREIVREKSGDITELDRQFANLSRKLKKRKTRNRIIGAAIIMGMLIYITVNIARAVKNRDDR